MSVIFGASATAAITCYPGILRIRNLVIPRPVRASLRTRRRLQQARGDCFRKSLHSRRRFIH